MTKPTHAVIHVNSNGVESVGTMNEMILRQVHYMKLFDRPYSTWKVIQLTAGQLRAYECRAAGVVHILTTEIE